MNIMNINNTQFGAAKPRVNWARNLNNIEYPVSNALKERIDTFMPLIEAQAKSAKTNVTLAQKGESLLINAGPLTTRIEDANTKIDEFLHHKISENIEMNALVQKGMSLKRFFGK